MPSDVERRGSGGDGDASAPSWCATSSCDEDEGVDALDDKGSKATGITRRVATTMVPGVARPTRRAPSSKSLPPPPPQPQPHPERPPEGDLDGGVRGGRGTGAGGNGEGGCREGSRRRRFDADADAEPGKTAGDGRGGGKSGGTWRDRHAEIVAESRLALLEARSRQFSRNLQLRSREIDENAGEVGELGTRLLQLEKTLNCAGANWRCCA